MRDDSSDSTRDPEPRDPGDASASAGAGGSSGSAGSAGHDDIDAEFAAMMEGLALPEEMRADLASLDGGSADDASVESAESGDSGEGEGPESVVFLVEDMPHNTYKAPDSRADDEAARRADDARAGDSEESGDEDGLTPEQAAEIEALASALEADGTPTRRAVKIAVVLTPLVGAEALASLCAMSGLDCIIVPGRSGAFAVKEFVSAHAEWDVSELLGGVDTEPAEAAELASTLSHLSRAGVVLLTADLATDIGIESGLSGTVTARRYVGGEAGEEASAGLLLASLDQQVEDVLLGITRAEDINGAVRSSEVRPSRTMRWLARGLRPPRRGRDDGGA